MSENQTKVVKFLNYLSNPNALSNSDLTEIKDWITKYPYSQSLKFIAVKGATQTPDFQNLLAQAATIAPSRKTLHDLIHQSENFTSTVLPFTFDDVQTIEERQIVVEGEEASQETEEPSKLAFGIDINEIYGSDYQLDKKEQDLPTKNIQEETQEKEQFLAFADEEVVETEEEFEAENVEEEKQDEVLVSAEQEVSEEVVDETEEESEIENIEEESQEEVITSAEEETEVENIEEEEQEEISASADEDVVGEKEEEPEVENIKEEEQEEVSASADEEVVVEKEEESAVENIEEEKQEEVSASADEEVFGEKEEEPAVESVDEESQKEVITSAKEETEVENIEEEQEEISASADEEVIVKKEEEPKVENIEEEEQEEVSASADEDVVVEKEEEPAVENIEEEKQEEISASADEDVVVEKEEEPKVENIEEEEQEEISASADEDVVVEKEEEPEVENIEKEEQEEISAFDDEEVIVEKEEEPEVENIEEEEQEEISASADEKVENIKEETSKEEEKEEPAFQYALQTDFFALNRKDKVEEKEAQETVETLKNADESVSAYNDERMPYTFLWWLNKTRKEHATNLQPYSSFKLDTSKQIKKQETEGLNHQIAENIFHLRGVEELSSSASNYTVPFDFRKKEFQIIEKFIKEEPQIRPPAANKIDSENKAKKSSEDNNQVVSETLAKIYVEQMLYHKALDVYKKLSLKFPEKSTYFASQIKYLELKVN